MIEPSLQQPTVTLAADPEHGGLRSAIFGLFFVVWVIGYIVVNALIPNDGLNLIAGIVGFGAAALLVSRVIEPQLRRRWPSGRVAEISASHIRLKKRDRVQREIKTGEPFSVLLWSFKIKQRRNRVPAGWFVMACALEQDDEYLPVYALVAPEQAKTLNEMAHFTALVSEKDTKNKDARQDSLRVAGEQRRLRLAETHRWADGAELTFADFEQFLSRLQNQFPQWMPFQR